MLVKLYSVFIRVQNVKTLVPGLGPGIRYDELNCGGSNNPEN
jgi:hypothetical protein